MTNLEKMHAAGSFAGFFSLFFAKNLTIPLDKPRALCYNHHIHKRLSRNQYADTTIFRETAVAASSQSGRRNTFGQLRTEPPQGSVGCDGRARYRAGVSCVPHEVIPVRV